MAEDTRKEREGEERFPLGHVESSTGMSICTMAKARRHDGIAAEYWRREQAAESNAGVPSAALLE